MKQVITLDETRPNEPGHRITLTSGGAAFVADQQGTGNAFEVRDNKENVLWFVDKSGKTIDNTFNVRGYGAKGDGLTDDTLAIQAAINAAGTASGGTVFFPRGKYLITATLTVPNFVTLLGATETQRSSEYGIVISTASTIAVAGLANFVAITNSDSVNGNTSIGIQNLQIDGTGLLADLPLVKFNMLRRSILDRCYLIGAATTSRYGLQVANSSEMNRVSDTYFEGCGIRVDNSNSMVIRDCEVGAAGIFLNNGFYHQVKGCQIYNNGTAAGVDYPAWEYGIYLSICVESVVDNNNVIAFSQDGIVLDSSRRCHVTNNTSIDNSRRISGVWGGILLETGNGANNCQDNIIQGNHCYNRLGTTQKCGIRITQTTGSTFNNRIFNNNLVGNAVEEITTNGFLNNRVRNPGSMKTYSGGGATQAVDAPAAELFTINITNTTAFTISNPTNPTTGAILTYDIKNSSGGTLGVITWGAAFLLAGAFTNPANGKRRTISFYFDGTNWVETNRAAADI